MPGKLGVVNAGPPPTLVTPDTPTANGSHSVAADPNKILGLLPIEWVIFRNFGRDGGV
jgi:hypothetical protein